MKIFGWKSAGRAQSRPAHLSVPLDPRFRSVGEWPRSYEAQVREGYLENPVAQRAVRLVAEGVASIPLVASNPVARALIVATSAGQSLLETLAVQILLHGNGYVQLLPGPDGAPAELYALRPERVSVEADARGWPIGFGYRAGKVVTHLSRDDIIHIRTHHPLDDHYGLGCLGAASGPIAVHNASSKWNKALLDNAARPSGALFSGGGEPLSTEQFERLKSELLAGYQGAANAGRPMLLEGGLNWQSMSLSPADMDFAGLKAAAARDIALAFGVPPVLLGLPGDATYANYREANKALWKQAILPLTAKILSALAEGLRPWFAGLDLAVDLDAVSALSEDRERLWAQVSAADFLTLEEKRAMAGFGLPNDDLSPVKKEIRNKEGTIEQKFNPWHDRQDGKFTAAYQGSFAGGGGSFGGGGASGSWEDHTPKADSASAALKLPVVKNKQLPKQKPTIIKPPNATFPRRMSRSRPKSPNRKITAGGYHFETDPRDRTVRAYGQLRIELDQRRSRSAQRNAGKPDRLPADHGGHFIAREFGGPEIRYNHFAQNARFNISDYRTLENDWKGSLKAGKKVSVDIRSTYRGNSNRPDRIRIRFTVGGKSLIRSFPNAK
jgi:HK97 family phage portal protein